MQNRRNGPEGCLCHERHRGRANRAKASSHCKEAGHHPHIPQKQIGKEETQQEAGLDSPIKRRTEWEQKSPAGTEEVTCWVPAMRWGPVTYRATGLVRVQGRAGDPWP